MINPFKEVNWNPDLAARKSFARSLVIGFPIVAVVLYLIRWLALGIKDPTVPLWIGGAGFAAGVVFWVLPQIAKPFYLVWYGLACCIGLVISNVILTVFYYTLMTLIGLLLRIMGKDPLQKSFNRNAKTYWHDAPQTNDPARYYQQF
ncbi:MAG: hypothetical protein AB1705_27815 [Verrucomicrobiota bacterium]